MSNQINISQAQVTGLEDRLDDIEDSIAVGGITDPQLVSLSELVFTGNELKVVRLNAAGDDFEFATVAAGSTTNAITFNNSGSGAASGSTFDGSAAKTISYNTIGAAALGHDHAGVYQPLDTQLTDFAALSYSGNALKGLRVNAAGTGLEWYTIASSSGTVTDVSVVTANGISGSVATSTSTPAITLTLGAITPSSVAATSHITAVDYVNVASSTQSTQFRMDVSGGAIGNADMQMSLSRTTGDITILGSQSGGQLYLKPYTGALTVQRGDGTSTTMLTLDTTGQLILTSTLKLKSYTAAGAPSASTAGAGSMYYQTDGATGIYVSNGTSYSLLSGSTPSNVTDGDKGEITVTSGSWSIDNGVVSLSKMANLAANSIIGNNTGSSATPIALTGAQTTALLSNVVGDSGSGGTKGLVPAPASGDAAANKYLKADGSWATVTSASPDPLELGSSTIYSTTQPSSPSQGVKLIGVKRANRHMPAWVAPTGKLERFQGALSTKYLYTHQPNFGATTYTVQNWAPTVQTTTAASSPSFATGTYLGLRPRIRLGGTTASSTCHVYGPLMMTRGSGDRGTNFHCMWRWGYGASLGSVHRAFIGLYSVSGTLTSANFSAQQNIVGLNKSSGSSSWHIVKNGSSGTVGTQSIGAGMDNIGGNSGYSYIFELFSHKSSTDMGYRFTYILDDGTVTEEEGTITGTAGAAGGLPANGTALAPIFFFANTTATNLFIDYQGTYIEID